MVQDEKLSSFVKTVVDALKPFGPCNVQFRLRKGTLTFLSLMPVALEQLQYGH